ncbi:sensor histidine kinase [Vermiculatibacterium agrestimuris]|uniref:sensor histidine kinase n=1 Tax=Vermiculatibacterium agrestimuris TaxID=2941519 RepID=UPI00203FFF1B|nr:HAMP domain-containing sensor histidine kinase [Vermiculatibacterium agrestimuris]
MKQDFRSYALVKAAALLLTVACAVGATFGCLYCGLYWDSFFEGGDYTYSLAWNQAMNARYSHLMEILDDYDSKRRGQALGYLEEQYYQEWLDTFSPAKTNFRYIIRDNATGEILLSSSGEDSLEHVPYENLYRNVRTMTPSRIYYNYREYNEEQNFTIFFSDNGTVLAQVPGNETYLYQDGETFQYALEYGIDERYAAPDEFRELKNTLVKGDIRFLYWTAALILTALAGTVLLLCCAGRRRGAESFTLNWTDKIPYGLYLLAVGWGAVLCFALGGNLVGEGYLFHYGDPSFYAMVMLGVVSLTGGFALTEAGLMSTATRIKTHTLLRNTVTWRCLCWIGRGFRGLGRWWGTTFGNWNLTQRVIVGFLLYLIGTLLTSLTVVLIPFYQGAVLFGLCKWSEQWRNIRAGTQAIVGGSPETVIDTSGMDRYICRDLKEHAGQLNDLGSAINTAVDERLRSERMKAELITNVSHDLKTPLTSIINYVDLLKKEDIQEEKAREYIEVLDRKSQRLKKLTEDLVEASKASTGALTVNKERLGVVQLVTQALGEYSEKFTAAQLTVIPTLTEEEVYVWADGRHFWRILDNLMGNCVKYAMPGTRVYLDLKQWDGNMILSLKNVSASQLNVPAEQLMERFVRGDESRTTEGSGLGLSIARSLTELQGGLFRLEVDGDLFKAVVSFPVIK